jgi:hypothetical protein
VVVVLGVIVNILVAVLSMYIGYRPTDEEPDVTAGGPATVQSEVVPFAGRPNMADNPANQWRDGLNNPRSAEYALSKLEGCAAFRSLTDQHKNQCYDVMGEVQSLIQEWSSETTHQKLAS